MYSLTSKLRGFIANNQTKFLYTVLIFINHFAYGLNMRMVGAVLVDLKFIYNTSIDKVSYLASFVMFGYLLGSMACWTFRWINRQLALIVLFAFTAVSLWFVPLYGKLYLIYAGMVVNGLGSGAWDSSLSIWLVEMWSSKSAAAMQAVQFMSGVGSIVAPILVSPFIHGESAPPSNLTKFINDTTPTMLTLDDRIKSMAIPFLIAGIIGLIVPGIFLILYFIKPYKNLTNQKAPTPGKPEERRRSFCMKIETNEYISQRKSKLALASICCAMYTAGEYCYFYFSSPMYQYLEIHLSAIEAARVLSMLSASYTVGRLVTAFLSFKLSPDTILTYHFVTIVGSLVLLFAGRNNKLLIYIGNVALGYGFSAMWPGMLAFADWHLKLSDRVCSIFSIITGIACLVAPLLLPTFIKSHPLILFVIVGGFFAVSIVLFIVLKIWFHITKSNKPVQFDKTVL